MSLFLLLIFHKTLLPLCKQNDIYSNLKLGFITVALHCEYLNGVQQHFKFS